MARRGTDDDLSRFVRYLYDDRDMVVVGVVGFLAGLVTGCLLGIYG